MLLVAEAEEEEQSISQCHPVQGPRCICADALWVELNRSGDSTIAHALVKRTRSLLFPGLSHISREIACIVDCSVPLVRCMIHKRRHCDWTPRKSPASLFWRVGFLETSQKATTSQAFIIGIHGFVGLWIFCSRWNSQSAWVKNSKAIFGSVHEDASIALILWLARSPLVAAVARFAATNRELEWIVLQRRRHFILKSISFWRRKLAVILLRNANSWETTYFKVLAYGDNFEASGSFVDGASAMVVDLDFDGQGLWGWRCLQRCLALLYWGVCMWGRLFTESPAWSSWVPENATFSTLSPTWIKAIIIPSNIRSGTLRDWYHPTCLTGPTGTRFLKRCLEPGSIKTSCPATKKES